MSLDVGFDNFIDNNESKKVEKEKNLIYTASDSPVSHSKSTTISSSNKLTFTMEVNETTAINWGLDIKGISLGGKVITASSIYLGHTNYTKNLQNVVSGYTINDDDALPFGDSINTSIYYDKVFGTYLFITDTNTSNTVNPREPWTKSPLNITPARGERGDDFKFISKMRKDLNRAEVRIQQPDEIDIATLQLFDDGMHGDGASGDGIYANIWNSAGASGEYYVDVISWDGLNRVEADNVATFNVFVKTDTPVHNINKGTNYTTIQAAIDDADPGDEIHVDGGTYYENVNVTKRLILRGIGVPVVDANGSGSAITLSADGITLDGFTAEGAHSSYYPYYSPEAGINVTSNNNILISNTANWNDYGISLWSSSNNTLIGNIASNFYGDVWGTGIFLSSSNNNTLIGNIASNEGDAWSTGISLSSSNNNTLIGNTANFNIDCDPSGCAGDGITLFSSNNNKLSGNDASSNAEGIMLFSSNNNTLSGNNASNNGEGITLFSSNNNTLSGNNANLNIGVILEAGKTSATAFLYPHPTTTH